MDAMISIIMILAYVASAINMIVIFFLFCREKVVSMFHHAYDGYIKYAYPYDELRPLTCDGHDTWGR